MLLSPSKLVKVSLPSISQNPFKVSMFEKQLSVVIFGLKYIKIESSVKMFWKALMSSRFRGKAL